LFTPITYVRIDDLIELGLFSAIALAGFAFARGLRSEIESARFRAVPIRERRRLIGEKGEPPILAVDRSVAALPLHGRAAYIG
jgi:hypothetical protein